MTARIAVIGSGISGLASAWLLSRSYDVTLYEANGRLGGHTDTHDIQIGDTRYAVDTGFIVYNPKHYPLLCKMFQSLGVEGQPTTMSFAVHNARSGLEYNATSINRLFCQRRNLFSPRFHGMVRDILRFYREAPALLQAGGPGPTLGTYLEDHGYGAAFRDDHIVPMASALWSSPGTRVLDFPAAYLVRFMANHHMLQVDDRPEWRVVRGGSQQYVHALHASWSVHERLDCPVRHVTRHASGVQVDTDAGSESFEHVVLACHSDQALGLLGDASDAERDILGAIEWQPNDTVLHTDTRVLPRNRKAWAAWNALIPERESDQCTVSYCMNHLQSIDAAETFIVSLNCSDRIDPDRILKRRAYHHPVYTHATVNAQQRKSEIQGQRNTWFAGAWWGWGFHEDGMRSAVDVAHGLGVDGP
ncbi:FAD-dependent oxidoreductase [Oleiagrimonas sp.]|jgi:predicted NAD/FAD-binding protein|uniref:NAD(P)/FAD-dependent oxidoreductase n=1 Tax=Oleiagrimonas sp. TaxID=2010330 RepID=UPI00262B7FA5|nr:FAD-dependent oxidoreductase [Oleiagrimonas sp.]MDA3914660.1 FAD-dependent oxidoreductase [Oleiagrimonas sp.]